MRLSRSAAASSAAISKTTGRRATPEPHFHVAHPSSFVVCWFASWQATRNDGLPHPIEVLKPPRDKLGEKSIDCHECPCFCSICLPRRGLGADHPACRRQI